jgi:hypothetical protein
MSDWNRHLRRISISPADAPLVDDAERRHRAFRDHEFKIRSLKHQADREGLGEDLLVLLLDPADSLARQILDAFCSAPDFRYLGQPPLSADALRLIRLPYSGVRHLFSPGHRDLLDRARPGDIRAALMSNGRTMATIVPGDRKLEDVIPFLTVQTEEDRKAGAAVPKEFLDAWDRSRDHEPHRP